MEMLIEKEKYAEMAKVAHITALKDVKELQLTENPALNREDDKMDVSNASKYVCPVTGLEMNGKHRYRSVTSYGYWFQWTCAVK